MRTIRWTLALLLAVAGAGSTAGTASAQDGGLAFRPHVGVYAPAWALVEVQDGYNPNVELGAGPVVGVDLSLSLFRPWINVYGGVTAAFSRLHHSGVLELRDVDGTASSRANLYLPTGGLYLTPWGGRGYSPTLRLGLGAKVYDFDLYDQDELVTALTGDFGLGVRANAGPVAYTVEARWAPSSFDASMLPMRAIGDADQVQNDWFVQIGMQLRPFGR